MGEAEAPPERGAHQDHPAVRRREGAGDIGHAVHGEHQAFALAEKSAQADLKGRRIGVEDADAGHAAAHVERDMAEARLEVGAGEAVAHAEAGEER